MQGHHADLPSGWNRFISTRARPGAQPSSVPIPSGSRAPAKATRRCTLQDGRWKQRQAGGRRWFRLTQQSSQGLVSRSEVESSSHRAGGLSCTWSQGYMDWGYMDRGYMDQGYVDQGYMDRGYVDRGYIDHSKQVVSLSVWASWCTLCREQDVYTLRAQSFASR